MSASKFHIHFMFLYNEENKCKFAVYKYALRRFPCDKCEYSAINNSRLKHHKETMHSGLKFTCDTHAVQITTAKQLRQIMREDVKFECEDCAIVAKGAIDILKKQKVCKVQ